MSVERQTFLVSSSCEGGSNFLGSGVEKPGVCFASNQPLLVQLSAEALRAGVPRPSPTVFVVATGSAGPPSVVFGTVTSSRGAPRVGSASLLGRLFLGQWRRVASLKGQPRLEKGMSTSVIKEFELGPMLRI